MEILRSAFIVSGLLALITTAEYAVATTVDGDTTRISLITVGAVCQVLVIIWSYMHVYELWRPGESN